MNDAAWAKGMGLLLGLGLPGWPSDPQEADVRARAMRPLLDDLSDEQWLFACDQAAREQTWFPVPATLRSYAEAFRPAYPLLPPARDAEAKERDRETAKRGVELVRQALRERGVDVGEPAKAFPE